MARFISKSITYALIASKHKNLEDFQRLNFSTFLVNSITSLLWVFDNVIVLCKGPIWLVLFRMIFKHNVKTSDFSFFVFRPSIISKLDVESYTEVKPNDQIVESLGMIFPCSFLYQYLFILPLSLFCSFNLILI